MDDDEIRQALQKYKFYHVIQLTGSVSTPGWTEPGALRTQALVHQAMCALELKGKRVLDIGCRDGLFSFAAERQGAAEIIGIDNDLSRGATEFLIPYFKSRVKMHELNLYDLTKDQFGTFDVVICAGVLYHLRFPFWGINRISELLADGGWLLLETAVRVDENREALLHCPIGSESPYEATSCTFFNTKGLTDTLKSFGISVQKVTYQEGLTPRPARFLKKQDDRHSIDRAVLICKRAPRGSAEDLLQQYWHGTHKTHTTGKEEFVKDPLQK